MWKKLRIPLYIAFIVIICSGVYFTMNAKFKFNFEDFFPAGDPDLEFFQEFVKEFETDDNFFLVAVEREKGLFNQEFLLKIQDFTNELRALDNVKEAISITSLSYPIKTPFGMSTIPAVHINNPKKYKQDSSILRNDIRFMGSLFNESMTSTAINLKLVDGIDLDASNKIVEDIIALSETYDFEDYHLLGRAYFQKSMIEMSSSEIVKSSGLAALLVLLIMVWIYRRPVPVIIALISILLAMAGFLTFIGITGQALSAMAGLYPVLMIIVSTSDIVHMMSKYIDELQKGKIPSDAIKTTLKEIGLATFLTSITTSIGFATLLFSHLNPIREFGMNAAVGVVLAFVIIVSFCAVTFPLFDLKHFTKKERKQSVIWDQMLEKIYGHTLYNKRAIRYVLLSLLVICAYGITQITTDYQLENNLPMDHKITKDYRYFEEEFAGFRPLEIAVTAKEGKKITDYDVLQEIYKVEKHLNSYEAVNNVISYTSVMKSINRMLNGNKASAYIFPEDKESYNRLKKYINSVPASTTSILVNEDQSKSRITSRVDDIGAETIHRMAHDIDQWIDQNIDHSQASFKLTGTALLFDKNTFFVRDSLLKGLGIAILIVSVIMMILFKDWKMLIISIVPNLLPLIISGAIIGFLGIELEAGLSIVFAIAFGIAVDDTIHFLSKYKIERDKGHTVEDSIHVTFNETGKAIVLTTIILFFGFMVMFFSIHPPSRSIGILISVTLVSALFADLYFLPGLIRLFYPETKKV